MKDKIFIYGAGGFGREVVDLVRDVYNLTDEEHISKVSFSSTGFHRTSGARITIRV
tara:strand:+ start:751 stop:918 length:168 start_codon:yes stop_codon:yes gene_type:complete